MAKAVLVHGRHLQAEGWEDIMWGKPGEGRLGQIPKALQIVSDMEADLVYWGTGASQKDGVKESQYAFNYAVSRAGELPEYEELDPYQIESMLKPLSFIDTETQNTTEEVARALQMCEERGIDTLILVSAPTHIARCLQEAVKLKAAGRGSKVTVLGTASDVPFEGYTAGDVVIVEPPHRGDMPMWQTFRYVRAIFGIMRKGDEVFVDFLKQFGVLLRGFGIEVTWDPLRKQ